MKTLSLVILLGLTVVRTHAQETVQFQSAQVATLADKRIHESSGLARSLRHPGIFWTLNDSGGEPCVFAINQKGETVAKVRIPKAANFDWEDIASGTDEKNRPCLFVADIGDNLKLRASLQIYRIPEPDLPADAGKETESAEADLWHLSYPDGRHNAETLLVHPQTRQIWIVTKEENGDCAVYEMTGERISGQAMKLQKVTSLSFPPRPRTGKRPGMASMTTGGSISPDGRRLVIATYSYLHEWKLKPERPLAESLNKPALIIEPPLTRQMEGVCYDADSSTLWFTSEQLPAPLYRLRRK